MSHLTPLSHRTVACVLADMAFSVAVPTNDEQAEGKIAAAYASDPGASPTGKYVSTDEAIKDAANHPNLRFLVIGNKHDCLEPIADYYPSPGNNNSKLTLAHPWQKPNATTIGVGKQTTHDIARHCSCVKTRR